MKLAPYIDHTLLKATATPTDIEQLCAEAREHSFYAVCLNPVYIPLAAQVLAGSDVKIATVCGFPLGAVSSDQKAVEARLSVEAGAHEIDMVIHIGAALAGDWDAVQADVRAVRQAIPDHVLKVIIETCYLNDEQKRSATEAAVQGGADFVKTSTGFGTGGATLDDVRLMRDVIAGRAQIKAAGGVRTPDDARAMIEAGATRLGTSGGVALVAGDRTGEGY
ncbi:deoxyribose-phosphate aldolase [Deinococcus sp.]|uniref:deoxyribose-phosphate aldolase n=1 Tax=Deinococcus sp. TaxID=47478 RepID=UPI002869AC27|nr:deoxyribose-phosphate aldolase [Deinococcus sp.]